MQTCREARNLGLYTQTFSDLTIPKCSPDPERRYVWLNLDIDVVSIGDQHFDWFKSVAPLFRQLKFARDNGYEFWERGESGEMWQFINARKIYVDIGGHDFVYWHGSSEDYFWSCGSENVYMIRPADGEIMNLVELEHKYDREWEVGLEK